MRTLLLLLPLFLFTSNIFAQEAHFPIIKNFGGIYEIPESVNPNPDMEYNIVIDLKTLQQDKESLNPGLNNVARMMNLHGLGGVKEESLSVVVVVHGGATDIVINNEAYQKRYKLNNPNLELIDTLNEAGVEIYVCGQSLLAREYGFDEINPQVTKGLSMLTVFTTYMNKGYKPLVFD
ncbi:MAG: DsrE family protein [Gracilimonas sp.]|uniref:DsrE family protein n=1 Tax=Gracilimonas sp. TaxID=1974203 RepID=UPI0019BE630E|nr:DsrE family protein [Gracilimonas sp.]MBD3615280.1 DsrE family protein [Gracilimonas sp.]